MRLHDRRIRAAFWQDTKLIKSLDAVGRMFFIGLTQLADDSGCLMDDCYFFKMTLFPMDEDVTIEKLESYKETLIDIEALVPYSADNKTCLFIKNFYKHQTLKNCAPPKVPLPPWVNYEVYKSNSRSGKYIFTEAALYNYLTPDLQPSYGCLTPDLRMSSNLEPRTKNLNPEPNTVNAEEESNIPETDISFCDEVTEVEPKKEPDKPPAEKEGKPTKTKKEPKFSDDAKEVAQYLYEKIRAAGTDHFPRDWLLRNYSTADRLLKTIPKARLMQCIDWAMADSYWHDKIDNLLAIERVYVRFSRLKKVVELNGDKYSREAYDGG